jgi:hypothetical protein
MLNRQAPSMFRPALSAARWTARRTLRRPGDNGKVVVQKLDSRRTRITAVVCNGGTSSGAGLAAVHLRPGTCSRIAAPEVPLTPAGFGGVTVVTIPFATIARNPHVVEGHGGITGDRVVGCLRLDGPPR